MTDETMLTDTHEVKIWPFDERGECEVSVVIAKPIVSFGGVELNGRAFRRMKTREQKILKKYLNKYKEELDRDD